MAAGQGVPPTSLRDQVVVEWVLTNGKLPGFDGRLASSLTAWETLDTRMTVYRAQGGGVTRKIVGTEPTGLQVGVRPILATSKDPASIVRYAEKECCLFEIILQPGTRYLDVSKIVKGPISVDDIRAFREHCNPEIVTWPKPTTGTQYIIKELLARCDGRTTFERPKKGETEKEKEIKEIVPPEKEIMVYAVGGTFSGEAPIEENIEGRVAKRVTFTPPPPPPSGGRRSSRGRTFRRTSRRRDKNGGRPTRKSKHHVRNRHAGNR
jgi:hypothetical protein